MPLWRSEVLPSVVALPKTFRPVSGPVKTLRLLLRRRRCPDPAESIDTRGDCAYCVFLGAGVAISPRTFLFPYPSVLRPAQAAATSCRAATAPITK